MIRDIPTTLIRKTDNLSLQDGPYHLIRNPDPNDNLLYCNNNPDPDTICSICAADIGRVFAPGTEPHVPRHDHCYCYYVPTGREPSPLR